MRIYTIFFHRYEKDYNPERSYVYKKGKKDKFFTDKERGLLVTEADLTSYLDFAEDGIDKIVFVGELDDKLFAPLLAEPDFVDNQIRSKKNGEILGYQG